MNRKEYILLLECLMKDIRGNWRNPTEVNLRKKEALRLAKILKFRRTVNLLLRFGIKDDGRWLRQDFAEAGGYVGMQAMHNFFRMGSQYSLPNRSRSFRLAVKKYITIPEAFFWDFD